MALMCIRPIPKTGSQYPVMLRKGDLVRCLCGQPNCRDHDVWLERQKEKD